MAYDEKLADRIREAIVDAPKVVEKKMFGGVCFMVNKKMCIGVMKDEMMCRINPDKREEALEKAGCRIMTFTGKPMKGFVLVSEASMKSTKDFKYWINLCLDFNSLANAVKRPSKKRRSTK